MPPRGKGTASKPTPKATAGKPRPKPAKVKLRRTRLNGDAVDVWVTYHLVGAPTTAKLLECGRRTVYTHLAAVEADPVLLEEGRARLKARREARDERIAQVVDAAQEALMARIRENKVPVRYLIELTMPRGAAPSKGGGSALQVPAFMTEPRPDTSAAAAPPPASPSAPAPPAQDNEA